MGRVALWMGTALVAGGLAACAKGRTNAIGGGGGGGGPPAMGIGELSSGTGVAASTGANTSASTSAGTSASASASTGMGAPAISASIVGSKLYVNCQPIIQPDPVLGGFSVKYANEGTAAGSATMTSAVLSFDDGVDPLSWPLAADPLESGSILPGATATVGHKTHLASSSAPGSPCDYCKGQWSLRVFWSTAGGSITAALPPTSVECVY